MSAMPPGRDPSRSRRDFLALIARGFLALTGAQALVGLARFLTFQNEPPPKTEFDLGPAAGYAPGTRTVVNEAQAVVVRTGGGFTALSLVCPHLGCEVVPDDAGFRCPCHGSRFDGRGVLQTGPASQSLRVLRLEETPDGHLILHTD